jgi:inward rectifier potassium channel
MTAHELQAADAALALNVSGVDDSSAQHLYARRLYPQSEILWGHRYRDITSITAEGRLLIDYNKFHDVIAEA